MDNTGMSIDDYVESLYRGIDGRGDAAELKEEMRDHLEDAAQRLRAEGYSETDSVRVAMERFGDEASVRQGLDALYASPGEGHSDSLSQTLAEPGQPPMKPHGASDSGGPRRGISALVYAILAVFIPVVGIPFAIIALVRAVQNLRRARSQTVVPIVSGLAIAIAIIALIWQLFYILGIFNYVLYFHVTGSSSAHHITTSQGAVTATGGHP
ncbi:permease prefix domain 1-containing protein [Alicyclobacillus sp. ALC3]|uniref:permease prefix domain 1-containing protein n=1 Tax=Alicyclobacillus sp. ALC3 TaxID=2796143 RepID=UPI0023794861|nr:permease prefix domain 1-containing protein [Alicyclobacillus sp. ALC3]WDL96158.1 hypothetical protein JC200_17725 [Alicyclobacillus sp. ALC3]